MIKKAAADFALMFVFFLLLALPFGVFSTLRAGNGNIPPSQVLSGQKIRGDEIEGDEVEEATESKETAEATNGKEVNNR